MIRSILMNFHESTFVSFTNIVSVFVYRLFKITFSHDIFLKIKTYTIIIIIIEVFFSGLASCKDIESYSRLERFDIKII